MKYLLILLTLTCITGCDDDNYEPNMDFFYPLAVGNVWEYDTTYTYDYDSLATYNGLTDTTFYSNASVEIISNEVIFDSIQVYNFATTLDQAGNISTGNQYFNNAGNCLFNYGYTSPGVHIPKSNTNSTFFKFDDKIFCNVEEVFEYIKRGLIQSEYAKDDSINYDPVTCLEYPLEMHNYWMYRAPGNPLAIDKEIVGLEWIEVPAGRFYCWKIRWIYPESDLNDNIDIYDFVSQDGLVKRELEVRNMAIYGDPFGEPTGNLDAFEETYLTNYDLSN